MKFVVLTGLVFLAAACGSSQAACLRYEPALVNLMGKISLRSDWGPPNYGEDPKHDSRESHYYLTLDRAVCVKPDKTSDINNYPSSHIIEMEMVYYTHIPFRHEWLGKHVIVSGTLFHAHTAHHWTPVLIEPTATQIVGRK